MKNLVLSLAFMLIGSFAFASNIEVKQEVKEVMEIVDNEKSTIEKTLIEKTSIENVNVQQIAQRWHCFDFNDSCGGSWTVCYTGYTFAQVVDILWAWDGGC